MARSSELQTSIIKLLADGQEHTVQEMKQAISADGIEDYSEGMLSGSLNTLCRNGSIRKKKRGIYQTVGTEVMRKCFVVSAIGTPDDEIRNQADKVFKYIIKPVCEETGFDAERADLLDLSDVITSTIIERLKSADLVIADISKHNPNAFFEMGYRAAVGKPIIYLRSKEEKIPFDIAAIRVYDYNLNDLDSVEEIKDRLTKTIDSMTFLDNEGDDGEDLKQADVPADFSAVIPLLFELKDGLKDIENRIKESNGEVIQSVVKAVMEQKTPVEDPNIAIMKAIMPELIKNPSALKTLMDISNKDKNQ
jgi:hypothetical protein